MTLVQLAASQPRQAPGPRDWPLLGNVGAARGLLPFLEQQWAEHGDVFRVRFMGFRAIVLANPEHIHHVLVTNRRNYVKGPIYDVLRRLVGDGMITLEGDDWRTRRNLAQPAFHRQSLEKLAAIMVDTGADFFTRLQERAQSGGVVLDVHREMVQLTLEVVIKALFGRDTFAGGDISYDDVSSALELLGKSMSGIQLPPWVPTPGNIKFQRSLRALDENVHKIVEVARRSNLEGTLLSMLLTARDEQGQALSDRALRDEVIGLYLAGHETTALALTWLFACLDGRPEIVARMRDEVDIVLGGREPTFAEISQLRYVRQVIDETLRFRSPAPMVVRNAVAEDELGGFHVPAGIPVVPLIWAAHRHPGHWQDPERFDPDRFAPANSKGRHASSYLPFSVGPRVCIGNMFSLVETTLLVAQLLQRFEIDVQSCADVKPHAVASVRPSRAIRVRLTNRR